MLNLDPGKLLVIGVVAIILLGPDRLPQVARQLGGAWRSFNEFRHRMESEVRNTMPDLPPTSEIARLARSPSALLNHLSNMSPEPEEEPDGSFQPPAPASQNGNAAAADAPADTATGACSRPARPADAGTSTGHHTGIATPADPDPCRTPAASPPVIRRGCSRRPDPELNGTSVLTLPFTGKRKSRPSPDNMTLGEHLGELRRRVIICVIAFVVAATIAVFAYEPILHFLLRPLCSVDATTAHQTAKGNTSLLITSNGTCNLFVTSPLDGLSLRVKIALFGGLVLASPIILFQIWRFVTPGLKATERRYAIPFVVSAFVLFLLGAATAYITLPHALGWLKSVGGPNLQAIYDPIPYLGLILLMMTIFGLTFEFPVVLVSLELAGVVTPARLLSSWRWAVIIIVVISAVFTPSSDPFSMLALAIPLIAFYFLSIGIGKLLGR